MRRRPFGLPLLALLLALGCGGDSRCEVSGTVTWKGQPIPAGEVIFEPDAEKGNVGPQVIVALKDGKFATTPGKGSVSGPVKVTVRGFNGIPSDHPLGKPLFPPYDTQHELPSGKSALDITVPAERTY